MSEIYPVRDGIMPSSEDLAEWLYDSYGWHIDEAREFAERVVRLEPEQQA